MRDYIELLHRGALESKSDGVMDCHAGPGQPFFRELFTPEFTAKAYALFAQAEAEAADPLIRNRIAKEKWGLLFTDLYLNSAKPGEILPAANTVGLETRLPALDECRKLSEFLRINRQFNRPWVVNPRAWHHFSLAAFTGFEPGCEPWWSAPRLRQLMDDPEAALQGIREADRRTRDGFVVLENRELQLLVVPGVGGRIWRMYHKGLKTDLLRRGAIPLSGLQHGLPASPYLDLGGYEEYTAKSFGSPGWSEAYEGQRSAAGDSIAMTVSFPNGLKLTRAVSLVPDKAEVVVQSGIENAGAQPVKGVLLRVHPEFLPPENEKPELEVRTADGGWRKVPYEAGDNFLTEENRPHGAWALRFPKAGLRIVDEFDPAQVETCYFYSGRNCCNLELFSAQKDLAPGEKVTLNHKYALTRH
jgi:hypothetical protein